MEKENEFSKEPEWMAVWRQTVESANNDRQRADNDRRRADENFRLANERFEANQKILMQNGEDLRKHSQCMKKTEGEIIDLEKKGIETQTHIAQSKERLEQLETKDRGLEKSLAESESRLSQVVSNNEEVGRKLNELDEKSRAEFRVVGDKVGELRNRIGVLEGQHADFDELSDKMDVVIAFDLEQVKNQFDKWKGGTDASLSKALHDASEIVRQQNIRHDTLSHDFSRLQVSTQMDHQQIKQEILQVKLDYVLRRCR